MHNDLDLHSTLTLSFQPKNGGKSSTNIFWVQQVVMVS